MMHKTSLHWFLLAWLSLALPIEAFGQMGFEQYQHKQFCEAEIVEKAAPGRATLLYLDAVRILRKHGAAKISGKESNEDQDKVLLMQEADEYRNSDWYLQLEGKLRSSLLPSETLSTILILPDSARVKEISIQCWPGYTKDQERELDDVGLIGSLFSADPRDHLDKQRILFFSDVRAAVAKAVAEAKISSKPKSLEYVRALSVDEARLGRMSMDKPLRVVLHGGFLERSNIGSIEDTEKPENMAQDAVKRFGYRAGGAYFHMYGVSTGEAGEKAERFWGEFLHEAKGYLVSFGPELSLSGDMPEVFQTVNLDILITSPKERRSAVLSLSASKMGEMLDSSIVVANSFRSRIVGTFSCDDPSDPCRSACSIKAEIQRSVLLKGADEKETIKLDGQGGELTGTMGIEGGKGTNMFEVEGGFSECL